MMVMPERSARLAASRSTLVLKPKITAPVAESADLTSFSFILPTLERMILGRILSLESFPSSPIMASRLPAVSALITRGKMETSFPTPFCGLVGTPTPPSVGTAATSSASSFFRNVLTSSPIAGILSQHLEELGFRPDHRMALGKMYPFCLWLSRQTPPVVWKPLWENWENFREKGFCRESFFQVLEV